MFSPQFNEFIDYHIKDFKHRFEKLSRNLYSHSSQGSLLHPGEFGMYREEICESFIRPITPSYLGIENGFVITRDGQISKQCDILIYDSHVTPISPHFKRFFPIETTLAIGEIKSVIQKNDLFLALKRLADIKRYRLEVKEPVILRRDFSCKEKSYDPKIIPYDQIFTFLICEKFDFDKGGIQNQIDEAYSGIEDKCLRHNIILSINDGVLLYFDDNGKSLQYPIIGGKPLNNRFIKPNENKLIHFKYFCSYFFMGITSTTVLYPEMTEYIGDFSGGLKFDQT